MSKVGDILSRINCLEDFKKLENRDLYNLAKEIREFIIDSVSKTGGHLASNLGVVELTIALHKVFNSPDDKIIWDVGHQAYIHKILTGRKNEFSTLRQFGGLSGFPKKKESIHDAFEVGHSSTSISAALGYALARDLEGKKNEVISIIGDGAMTAGMAFEGLNHIGHLNTKQIIVLNDNEMSIDQNIGGLSKYLNKIRTAPTYYKMKHDVESILNNIPAIGKIMYKTAERAKDSVKYFFVPGIVFEELGLKYIGPVDGHNISELISVFERAKKFNGPVLVHVLTKKGKGYLKAENNPDKYHGISPFDKETGKPFSSKNMGSKYSDILGETLTDLAKEDEKIVAITAAMPSGTGLNQFRENFKDRFFDVGIAEQHGVTLSAGLASSGFKPYFAVYSTFLQRGYDQVLHDVCIQNLPVVFAIDRGGLVGEDGETHHGVFDFSYLTHIPNMTVMAPKDKNEFINMIKFSANHEGPIAIRYPRGYSCDLSNITDDYDIELGKGEILNKGKDIAIVAIGKTVEFGYDIVNSLKDKGIDITLVNGRFAKPLDKDLINDIAKSHHTIITYEDNSIIGGFGSLVNSALIEENNNCNVINIGLPDTFIEHGKVDELYKKYEMDAKSVENLISKLLNKEC